MQHTHYTATFKKQKHPISLVCDNINNAPNIGSLFRIADAFNIEELIFCGDNVPLGKRITKTSRSTQKYVKHKLNTDINAVIKALKTSNHYIIALEITDLSIELNQFKLKTDQPLALVLGDENFGICEDVLHMADTVVHINMYGNNSSMNVAQATSIALYEITNQLNY
ncbi:TrmH family RNA methyltransferase [uncultured Winogradskyella sp.]|uniref:TrmH family RNA methyltransferase n=1 Tax=uncultured Winogradskyella sp. TaxID=395353 RepID=UPI0026271A22|nr:TrmH family RNA methyltransferase [uncultured Winogradskyella sp.]